MLYEYTNMIDIGTQRIPRFDRSCQTDISLMEMRRDDSKQVVDLRDNTNLIQRIFEPIESLSLCKDKEYMGLARKSHADKIIPFKKIFFMCEDLIDDRDPRPQSRQLAMHASTDSAKGSQPDLKLPESVQVSGQFQKQYMNYMVMEQDGIS